MAGKRLPVVLLAFLTLTLMSPTLAGAESSEDTEPPQLLGLTIEPAEVDTTESSQKVTFTAHVSDNLAGISSVGIGLSSPSESQFIVEGLNFLSGTTGDALYRGSVTIPQFAQAGAWKVTNVYLNDNAHNGAAISAHQLEERGLPSTVQVDPPPTVAEVSPGFGLEGGGTAVEISGTGLGSTSEVRFGSTKSSKFTANSPTSITAIAPAGSGTVDVIVVTPNGTSATSAADRFRYAPTVSLTSTPNPSIRGAKVTFTAKVVPTAKGSPTPSGTVAFVEGSMTLGVKALSKGTATFSTTALSAGSHSILAEYGGDSYFGQSESAPLAQVVSKAATQLTLVSSLNPAPFGSVGTLSATVKAVAPGAGTPSGSVIFSEGKTALATVSLSGAGVAKYALKTVPPGTHMIVATYTGNADYEGNGADIHQEITKASTQLSLSSSLNPAPYGSSATLKATVKTLAPGGGTPPGTVTFSEGPTALATVPLSGTTANYALKSLAPGVHEITATYSGDVDYQASEANIGQTIAKASTALTLTSSKNPAPRGSSGTLKATVKAVAPGGGTPSGAVTFRDGEAVLATVPLSGNAATYPLKSLSVGTHEVTAVYNGDPNYEVSKGAISQAITP